MTSYAKNLGMTNTNFKNASGLPNRAQLTTARDISILSYSLIYNFPEKYKLFSNQKFTYNGKTYKTHNKLMLNYEGADGIKTGYIKASGFQLAFSAVRNNKRLIGVIFGGDTGKQRDSSLKIIMDKEFSELGINKNETKTKIAKQETKIIEKNSYSIVVGTFKYRNNAKKQIKLIKSKYPKTTNNKKSNVVLIKVSGKQLYESRKFLIIDEIKERLKKEDKKIIDIDGVRVENDDGWFLMRASNTQNQLTCRAESISKKGLHKLIGIIEDQLSLSGISYKFTI